MPDPRQILAESRMSTAQVLAVALCVLLNSLDGFDALSISFASPGLAREWGLERSTLGIVLSMELIGMAIGSISIGSLCDRFGRRISAIGCLVLMIFGMGLAGLSGSAVQLVVCRIITGLGIGGMLATNTAMVAEMCNRRTRGLAISMMATGYPLGVTLGGWIASEFLVDQNWRYVFFFGASISLVCLPLALVLLPETISWIMERRPPRALERCNQVLRRMGQAPVSELPPREVESRAGSFAQLFTPTLKPVTLLLMTAYFTHCISFYFLLKWIPKVISDMGFAASSAGNVLVLLNLGGILGSVSFALLTRRMSIPLLTMITLALSAVFVAVFGQLSSDLTRLSIIGFVAGIWLNTAMVGLYALFGLSFPTSVRASGVGLTLGVGRGGAILGPVLAGFLFSYDLSLGVVSLIVSGGSLAAAVAVLMLLSRGQTADSAEPAFA